MYKVLRVIWDNSSRYSNISEELKQKMMTATRISVGQLCHGDETLELNAQNFFITHDLNDIIHQSNEYDYTHILMFSVGVVLEDTKLFIEGLKELLIKPTKIFGHILHQGIKDNNNLFTLHDQMLLLSKDVIDNLKKDDFVFNNSIEYSTDKWIPVTRSDENVHDDYTPLKIWRDPWKHILSKSDRIIHKTSSDGFGEDLIQYAMKKDWEIKNVNNKIRKAKKYSYYNENSKNFEYYLGQSLQTIQTNKHHMSETQYDFLRANKMYSQTDNHTKWFGYNNEDMTTSLPHIVYDSFIGVASGHLPWQYLSTYNFNDNTKVLMIDINNIAINFQRWFLKNYDPNKDATWQDWIEMYENTDANIDKTWSERNIQECNNKWKEIKIAVDENWEKIKNYTYEFECVSMISNKETTQMYEHIKQANQPMLWFSNIFTFDGVYFYDNKSFEVFLSDIFSANQKIVWAGQSPYTTTKWSNGPNSIPESTDDYCKEIQVQSFDVDVFLNEIENLEKHNLFVKHRSDKHPGWSSFVLHGIDWNKTNDYGDYGYNSNEETPYKFVDYAKQHIPSIVEYFQKNQINKISNYYRIRIMKLEPGGYICLHNDTPDGKYHTDGWNLNMSINNPQNCEMHFWNDKYLYLGQVPWKPGKAFQIRTGYNHLVRNLSNQNRYHIIIHGE